MHLPRFWAIGLPLFCVGVAGCPAPLPDDCRTPLPAKQSANPPGVDVAVDVSVSSTSVLSWGPLNGTDYFDPVNRAYFDAASARLEELRPTAWRVAGTKDPDGGDSGYGAHHPFLTDYRYPERFGTKVTLNLQEIFVAAHGKPLRITALCGGKRRDCWPTFDAMRAAWKQELADFLTGPSKHHCTDEGIDFFELGSEPEYGSYVGVSDAQTYELMLDAYELVKACKPSARMVGPSTVAWNEEYLEGFFDFMTRHQMHLDAISWHEFGDDAVPRASPNAIAAHVARFHALLERSPALCEGGCPEVHINEFQGGFTSWSPGHTLSWLSALEAAGVDSANQGCWDAPFDGKSINTCFNGFSGLLMPAPSTDPQPLFWVYKYLRAMDSSRFAASSSTNTLSVIAGPLPGGAVGVLIGNGGIERSLRAGTCQLSGVNHPSSTLQLTHLDAARTSAKVSVFVVTSHPGGVTDLDLGGLNTYGVAAPKEVLLRAETSPVSDGVLTVTLPPLAAGDLYWVVVE